MDMTTGLPESERPRRSAAIRRLTAQERIDRALSEMRDEHRAVVLQFDELVEMLDARTIDFGLLREYIAIATYWTWRDRQRSQRARANHRAMAAATDRATVKSLGAALARPLLDFVLIDGTILREATATQVETSGQHFVTQGVMMTHLSRFLTAIRTAMDAEKPVGESVDEPTARRLFEETTAQ